MFTLITFIFFVVLVGVISFYKTRGSNTESADGYFLAGRGLSGVVIASSIMLTNLSTEQIIGLNGQSYMTNMGPMAWEATACVSLGILALIFLPKYFKSGITTIPDFLEERYDSTTKRIVSLLLLLGYIVTYIPTVLYSGAIVINKIFGISDILGITTFQAIALTGFIISVIGCIYAVYGGLKLCAVSDTINGIGLLVGGLMVPVLGIISVGHGNFVDGFNVLLANPQKLNAINPANSLSPLVPWPVLMTGLLFNNLFYFCTNQSIVQRALGAKNLEEAQKGAIYAGFLKLIGPFFLVLPGVIAFAKYGTRLENADMAYPTLLIDVLPKSLLGFFAAVLFGAIMSSFNGALNSSATLFTLDLYKPLMKPKASDKELVHIGRKFNIIVAIIATCVAPFILYAPTGLYGFLQECFGFYNVPILAAVVVGFYSKRVPKTAPKIAFFVHIALYTLSKFLIKDVHFLYVLGVLFPTCVIVMLIIGKLHPRENDFIQENKAVVSLTPWKHAKLATGIMIGTMCLIYLIFSPLGIGQW
ncbi:transporter [Clostridium botulinum]|uniref:solute:sodium symporter family transporter n=1 Tax=Clostridium botulinum TaxID=1491 RepID=UPI000597D0FD|nr:solute:sodium symporter family transporter [Clostridium botulinum]KIL09507.1 transporter [Clostridium botulinum]MBY6933212.1 solute:sodium symporter family transporter [Clostridium botulinum]NFL84881.1 solute:sodium symporter family transporter [Clostridium botulinum]NFN11190.1 solute:sodium symporter family transporter [Clostridium botulinum]NFO37231.1 solute:sodium symporter family transporter [Clostridium botulinum]